MMGEMERIKAIIDRKMAKKKEKELEEREAIEKKIERERIFKIAEDEKAPAKYRQAYIAKKEEIEAKEKEKEEEDKIKEAKRIELDDYFKKAHQKKLERGKRLMEKYGKGR